MRHPVVLSAVVLSVAALVGCPPPAVDPVKTGCDPVDPTFCGLPYPSSYYLEDDATTETGVRVALTPEAMPENRDGVVFDPKAWNRKDGFSVGSMLLTYFDDVSLDGTISMDNPEGYLADDAKTVIVDVDTGERVAHWVELDMTAENPRERLLLLHPFTRLEFAHRYVVGVRGLKKKEGADVDLAPAFVRLRDGEGSQNPDVLARRAHYEEVIFPALEAQGFTRGDLQLAWDFTTASRQSTLGDLLWVRDDALSYVENEGMTYRIDSVVDEACPDAVIGRTVEGTIENFPLYLSADHAGRPLARDANDQPMRNGSKEVHFLVRVPCSAMEGAAPKLLVQYGHGFFGDRYEARTGWLSRFINDQGYVLISSDWTGMTFADAPEVALSVATDISGFSVLPEGTFQGFVEKMAILRLARGALAQDTALTIDVGGSPVSLIDPDRFAYYGISQGGILGGAYVGMSPDLTRAGFGATGGPYSFLTHRSRNFDPFFDLFKAKYVDHREITMHIANLQLLWDPGDPIGWGFDMNRDVPDGYPAKQVLMQNAVGDPQVSPWGGFQQARMYGAETIEAPVRPIFGVPEVPGVLTGSAIVEWEFEDVDPVPLDNVPVTAGLRDPHECPRRVPEAQAQMAHFLETGEIIDVCDGGCYGVAADICP